jgi:hypothetical protein
MKKIIITNLLIFIILSVSCKKDKKIVLAHQYSGSITYEYSRDFPDFSCVVGMPVFLDNYGTVTFGDSVANSFEGEDIYYDGLGTPSLKMRVIGGIDLISAIGQYQKMDNNDYLIVSVSARTTGTKFVWNWDAETQTWAQPSTGYKTAINYVDTYAKGQLMFSIAEACLNGSSIKDTVADVHGNFIYGYTLHLMESSN